MQQMSVGRDEQLPFNDQRCVSKMMIEGDEAFARVFREFGGKNKIMKQ